MDKKTVNKKTVHISRACIDKMLAHAKTQLPLECCGLLAGTREANRIFIREIYELTNIDRSSQHFSMDPREQFAAVRKMRAAGYELLGNYHSHPETPSRPSEEDIKLAYEPDYVYAIISLAGEHPVINLFRIDRNRRDKQVEKYVVLIEEIEGGPSYGVTAGSGR